MSTKLPRMASLLLLLASQVLCMQEQPETNLGQLIKRPGTPQIVVSEIPQSSQDESRLIDGSGNTLLHFACLYGNFAWVKEFLVENAKNNFLIGDEVINRQNDRGLTAVQIAYQKGYDNIVQLLTQYGALPPLRHVPRLVQPKRWVIYPGKITNKKKSRQKYTQEILASLEKTIRSRENDMKRPVNLTELFDLLNLKNQ